MKIQSGFTLIELILVIVILGVISVVAAPRFMDVSDNANRAVVNATASALKAGITQVHIKWQLAGAPGAVLNFIEISDAYVGGDLSVNEFGYPADTRGGIPSVDGREDCMDVFRAVLLGEDQTVSSDSSGTYTSAFSNSGGERKCRFTFNAMPQLLIEYNSHTGSVIVTDSGA